MTQASTTTSIYCDTTYYRYKVGGYVLAVKYDQNYAVTYYDIHRILFVNVGELVTETTITNSYVAGDTVCPCMACYPSFGSDTKANTTRTRGMVSVSAEEVYAGTALPIENETYSPTLIGGIPAFDFDINEDEDMEIIASHAGELSSSGRGSMWFLQGAGTYTSFEIKCSLFSREEYWNLIGFCNYVKGRGRAFWIRNYSQFITPFASGTGYIEVADLDQLDWEDIKHIWAEDDSGAFDIVAVSAVTAVAGGFRISFATPSVTPTKYFQAFKARMDSDEIKETWFTNSVIEITLGVRELQGD